MTPIVDFVFTVLAITYGPLIVALLVLVIALILGGGHVRAGKSEADRG